MFRHVAILVALYEESQLAGSIGGTNRGVRTNDRLSLAIFEGFGVASFYDETRGDWDERGLVVG